MQKDMVESFPGRQCLYGLRECISRPRVSQRGGDDDLKVRVLAVAINNILAERKLTQKEAAKLLGINQPKVSALQRYRLDGFSVARLMQFVTALEYDVVIELRHKASVGR